MIRRVGVVACLVTLLSFGVLVSPSAFADSTPPSISSVRLVSQPVLRHPVVVDVAASDPVEQGSGIRYVSIGYALAAPDGKPVGLLSLDGYGSGQAETTTVLGPWTAAGHWEALDADVTDLAGNSTVYHRDGTVSVPPGSTQPPSLDLSVLDFTLSNPQQDIAAPVIDSAAPVWSTVRPGQPMAVLARARDDRSQVADVYVDYTSPSGKTFGFVTPTRLGAAGFAEGVLPLGSEPGVWHATTVMISDNAGNQAWTMRQGSTTMYPEGVQTFTTQSAIDWGALDVTVASDAPADTTPPVLNSFDLMTSSTVRSGDYTEIGFDATDLSGVALVVFTYTDSSGREYSVASSCRNYRPAVALVTSGLDLGTLTLHDVWLADRLDNVVKYLPDGTTRDRDGNIVGHHDLDLTQLNLTSTTGAGPGTIPSTLIGCHDSSVVTTTAPTSALRGSSVDIDGTVTSDGQPVPDGVVALYRTDLAQQPRLMSLVSLTSSGTFHGSLTLNAPTTVRAEYLGGGVAPAALGPNRTIKWKRGVALRGASTTGPTATFTSHIVPQIAGARMLLQWLTPRGWDTTAIAATDSTGTARFTIRPPLGVRRYRAAAQESSAWAVATSPTLTHQRTY